MTVYVSASGPMTRGPWVSKDDGTAVPATVAVTCKQLKVGDIIILDDWSAGEKRSAAVTMIESVDGSTRQLYVTTIDGVGKVEKHTAWISSKMFNRQCSQEQADMLTERGHNIVLRRQIESLRKKVAESAEGIGKRAKGWKDYHGHVHPGVKNPKLPSYLTSLADVEKLLAAMYKEVGDDLGIRPPVKKHKKIPR